MRSGFFFTLAFAMVLMPLPGAPGGVLGSGAPVAAQELPPPPNSARRGPGDRDGDEGPGRQRRRGERGEQKSPAGQPAKDHRRRGHVIINTNLAFARAEAFRKEGKCPEAVRLYSCLVSIGAGFEMAEHGLGMCMINLADGQAEDDKRKRSLEIGVAWLKRAANAGLADSQRELIRLYLDGKTIATDKAEAGKWYRLFENNPVRLAVGGTPLSDTVKTRLFSSLDDAGWASADKRAAKWRRHIGKAPESFKKACQFPDKGKGK